VETTARTTTTRKVTSRRTSTLSTTKLPAAQPDTSTTGQPDGGNPGGPANPEVPPSNAGRPENSAPAEGEFLYMS